MRPARRWAGVLSGIWLGGLLTMAAQGVPSNAGRGVTVSGTVGTSDNTRLQSGAAIMNPVAGDPLASHPVDDALFSPDGSFSFGNVSPGVYQIRVRAQTIKDAATLFAGYRVQVRDRDITGLRLVLRPGATVSGTVEVDPVDTTSRVPGFESLRVRAPFVDGSRFADGFTGLVQSDGRFRLTDVMEGDHYLTLDGLPAPWVLKRAQWRGVDVASVPFSAVSGDPIEGVRITISTRGKGFGLIGGPAADLVAFSIPAVR